jgi:hypothetical protein
MYKDGPVSYKRVIINNKDLGEIGISASEYMEKMGKDSEWSEEIDFMAAASLLEKNIIVFRRCFVEETKEFTFETYKSYNHSDNAIKPDILILFSYKIPNNADHFDLIFLVESFDLKDANNKWILD